MRRVSPGGGARGAHRYARHTIRQATGFVEFSTEAGILHTFLPGDALSRLACFTAHWRVCVDAFVLLATSSGCKEREQALLGRGASAALRLARFRVNSLWNFCPLLGEFQGGCTVEQITG